MLGTGHLKKEIRLRTTPFTKIMQHSDIDLHVEYSITPDVRVVAHENFFPHIHTETVDGEMVLSTTPNISFVCRPRMCPMRIIVKTHMVTKVESKGMGHVYVMDTFYPDRFVARTTNRGTIFAKVKPSLIQAQVDGPGDIVLEGSARRALFRLNSSGSLNAFNMKVRQAEIQTNGTGNANVWVTEDMEVVMHNGGNVVYHGTPTIDRQNFGYGSLKRHTMDMFGDDFV